MRLLILALAVIFVSEALGDIHAKWQHHVGKHNKTFYNKTHELASKEKFAKLDRLIELHNQKASEGKKSFFLAHNTFSSEISTNPNHHKGLKPVNRVIKREYDYGVPQKMYKKVGKPLPDSWDWREHGFNSDIRNQGICGSCWSFSSTASIEAQYALKKNVKVTLSPEELIDCSAKEFGTDGCDGAHVPYAFAYIIKYGITDDASLKYAYENSEKNTKRCPANIRKLKRYTISGITHIKEGDVEALRDALYNQGPIAIGVDASSKAFSQYSSGIWDGTSINEEDNTEYQCSTEIDHAVLLVGYGRNSQKQRYWIIKNQWGTDWGEDGYMYLLDDGSDMCGIASYAWFPNL